MRPEGDLTAVIAASVLSVARKRHFSRSELNSYLMASARVQHNANQCFAVRLIKDPVIKARPAHTLSFALYNIAFIISFILKKQILKPALLLLWDSLGDGKISFSESFFRDFL